MGSSGQRSPGRTRSPWFRIFNPTAESERFGPFGEYVRRWIPEREELDGRAAHRPWDAPITSGRYPAPIVDHRTERAVALTRHRATRDGRSDNAGRWPGLLSISDTGIAPVKVMIQSKQIGTGNISIHPPPKRMLLRMAPVSERPSGMPSGRSNSAVSPAVRSGRQNGRARGAVAHWRVRPPDRRPRSWPVSASGGRIRSIRHPTKVVTCHMLLFIRHRCTKRIACRHKGMSGSRRGEGNG